MVINKSDDIMLSQHCPFNIATCPGCTSLSRPDFKIRRDHEIQFWQTIADISGLKSPSLNWTQLRQSFFRSYYAMGVLSSSKNTLQVLSSITSSSLALEAAHDALSLIHLGAHFKDQRLLLEGRKKHLLALQHMFEEVDKPNAAFEDCLLSAAFTLCHCEVYKIITNNNSGWMGQIDGFYRILEIRGPKSITSAFAQAMLHKVRQISVTESFLKRRANFLVSDEWMACANQRTGLGVRATNFALRVGVLLEKADQLCRTLEAQEMMVVALLDEMVSLENQLQRWLLDFYGHSDGTEIPSRVVPTSAYTSFFEQCGALADVVPSSIAFPSLLSATSHNYIRICLLLLRQSIAAVARRSPYPLLRRCNQDAELMESAEECALQLCQSIAFLSQSEFGFAGVLACGAPLHFACEWYKSRGNRLKARWCEHVRSGLQRDILLDGTFNTSLDLDKPVLVWWMLPDIFEVLPDEIGLAGSCFHSMEEVTENGRMETFGEMEGDGSRPGRRENYSR